MVSSKFVPTGNNRGVALLLAVTVISLLVAVTVQFNKDMRHELNSSTNMLTLSKLNAMVKSGYNMGVAVLIQDGAKPAKFDTGQDDWATLALADFSEFYGSGSLNIAIDDLGSRIQLNSLGKKSSSANQGASVAEQTRKILHQLLLSGDLGEYSDEEASLIVDAITDWIDKDDDEKGIEETESSYYLSRQPSYSCKNGPMDFVEELLLIRGITPALYYGNGEFKGLRDLVTVQGDDGKININTAPAEILKALNPAMSEELAEKMVSYRQEEDNKDLLQDVSWYSKILPGDIQFDTNSITTVSNFFRITAAAQYNQIEKTLVAVVHRTGDNNIEMISRKVE